MGTMSNAITLDSRVSLSKDVLSRTVEDEDLILSLEAGLEDVGSLIWSKVQNGSVVSEIVKAVENAYDVSAEVAKNDTVELIQVLVEKKLATVG